MAVIDCDSHLFEQRGTWRDHIDPRHRDDALAIEDDEHGHAWLTWRDRRLYPAEVQFPGRPGGVGDERHRRTTGQRAEARYDDLVPREYWDPAARAAAVAAAGIDATVAFPNFGLVWEEMLASDLDALHANLRAANRWMAGAVADGAGRIHGVAQVSLRDPAWAEAEIARVAHDGIRLAMIAPDPPAGRRLSHPGHDRVWAACCDHGVAPVFHVAGFRGPFDPAWYAPDPEPVDRLLNSVFLWVAPAVAVSDLILCGTLARFPALRIGIVELSAGWVGRYLLMLDGASDFYAARHGGPLVALDERPSTYFLRQVRVGALAYEQPAHLVEHLGPATFMYGSDWPHAEGIAHPLADYERHLPAAMDPTARDALLGGNAAWLLGLR